MRVLDLFSGIGGFSLGLERAGMTTVAFCEIEPFCRAVLRKHWPTVPIYDDVRQLTAARLRADGISIDVICGGFPCQDISNAGKRAGIDGERSGLWSEYARIISELRPRYVIVENVAALLSRGLGRVLGDLAALGFDAEWHCIPASAVGAPHRRDRLWIVAYARDDGHRPVDAVGSHRSAPAEASRPGHQWKRLRSFSGGSSTTVADPRRSRLSFAWTKQMGTDWQQSRRVLAASRWWSVEPDVGRVANGVPARVDRLKSLGNAVVPQIPEIIGRAIMTPT